MYLSIYYMCEFFLIVSPPQVSTCFLLGASAAAGLGKCGAGRVEGRPATMDTTANPDATVVSTSVLIQKQDPGFPYLWRYRYFAIDHKRGALVYSEDAAGTKIKGAIALECCLAVTPCRDDKMGFSVEIADRTFICRFPKPEGDRSAKPVDGSATPRDSSTSSQRDAFVTELLDAIAGHPQQKQGPKSGGQGDQGLPPSHWKDQGRYRSRKLVSYEEREGTLSRQAKAGYPKRAAPLILDWKLPLSTYQPPRFTAAKHLAADAVAAREVDWGARCSWAGPIELFDGALG